MGIVRAETIARMRGAFEKGLSASRFITDMKAIGLSYRRTDMLADWREQSDIKKKDGLLRFVRKDRYPTNLVIASIRKEVKWEVMYKVKVQSRLRPDEPITERFVNIVSDVPMTPAMIEAEIEERWGEWEKYAPELLTGLQVWSAYKRET